jgi:hypothetical protein
MSRRDLWRDVHDLIEQDIDPAGCKLRQRGGDPIVGHHGGIALKDRGKEDGGGV